MISPEEIRLYERDDLSDFARRITAELRLRSDVQLSEFAIARSRNSTIAIQEARNQAGRVLWQKLYGDLPKEIHELRRNVMHELWQTDPRICAEIDEQFSKLLARLRPPV